MMVRLPVSRRSVIIDEPGGAEDMLLAEATAHDVALALDVLQRLVREPAGGAFDLSELPLVDLEVVLLQLRMRLLGEVIRSDASCQAEGCGARVEIGFRVPTYLAHHAPGQVQGVVRGSEPPWWSLDGGRIAFRIPTVADHLAARAASDPEAEILRRCVRGEELAADARQRIEETLDTMAPSLFTELTGSCPECGVEVRGTFDPVSFVLRELSRHASSVYAEIHLLASRYHWSEQDLLALPRRRRARYIELVQAAG